ncbi:MAG: class I SAM-dependent methyltransferase [Oscillospiraceae bacterium]|nr:class I SAM-dependent methyltransferase [Oscillospiraceae bacterium]
MKKSKIDGYELLDVSDGERLERWGDSILVRPDPQVIWQTAKNSVFWKKADAKYVRSKDGGGTWHFFSSKEFKQIVKYEGISFLTKPTNFKHMGLFPEQEANWCRIDEIVKAAKKPVDFLNLFGYTGAVSLVAGNAGAKVCHVDAAKGMVAWGKENAKISRLSNILIRWIVDDCFKFVEREIRRGNKYDIIMLDPPSYGRGSEGEFWKFEKNIYAFLNLVEKLLSNDFLMVVLNLYTAGFGAGVVKYLLQSTIAAKRECCVEIEEIGLNVAASGLFLPCGIAGVVTRK